MVQPGSNCLRIVRTDSELGFTSGQPGQQQQIDQRQQPLRQPLWRQHSMLQRHRGEPALCDVIVPAVYTAQQPAI
ncbi:hypothetical protein ACHAWF_014175 [Thalassiosira exigua]